MQFALALSNAATAAASLDRVAVIEQDLKFVKTQVSTVATGTMLPHDEAGVFQDILCTCLLTWSQPQIRVITQIFFMASNCSGYLSDSDAVYNTVMASIIILDHNHVIIILSALGILTSSSWNHPPKRIFVVHA